MIGGVIVQGVHREHPLICPVHEVALIYNELLSARGTVYEFAHCPLRNTRPCPAPLPRFLPSQSAAEVGTATEFSGGDTA